MAASTRIKAQNITFSIGSVDYACDATSVSLELGDAPGDVRTFCEVSVGKQWALSLEGITSGEVASLYRVLWDNYGTEVAFTIAPSGGAASAASPHYEGTVVFNELPPLSLTAGEIASFSVTLEVVNTNHDPAAANYWGVSVVSA
tara:strand:+ start:5840 stop:6274 length:435 start_codon:yes stop_codon:yes gene_type:complete